MTNRNRKQSRRPSAAWRAEIPVREQQTYEVDIVGLTHEGEGVGRIDGFTLFVRGALPGERVVARVVGVKKQYGHAEMVSVLKESEERVTPPCPIYGQCGGCQLQHLSYEAQLSWKRQMVVEICSGLGSWKWRMWHRRKQA